MCCLDADDMISPEYFLRAMELVAKSSGVNLVYANQQFFFESKWQWNVRCASNPTPTPYPYPYPSPRCPSCGSTTRSLYLPASPCISLHLPASPCISLPPGARAARRRRNRARPPTPDDPVEALPMGSYPSWLRRGATQGVCGGLGLGVGCPRGVWRVRARGRLGARATPRRYPRVGLRGRARGRVRVRVRPQGLDEALPVEH